MSDASSWGYRLLERQWSRSHDPWLEAFRREHPKDKRERYEIFVSEMKSGTKGTDALVEKFVPEIKSFSTPIDETLAEDAAFLAAVRKILRKRNRIVGVEKIHVEDLITIIPKAKVGNDVGQ